MPIGRSSKFSPVWNVPQAFISKLTSSEEYTAICCTFQKKGHHLKKIKSSCSWLGALRSWSISLLPVSPKPSFIARVKPGHEGELESCRVPYMAHIHKIGEMFRLKFLYLSILFEIIPRLWEQGTNLKYSQTPSRYFELFGSAYIHVAPKLQGLMDQEFL